MILKLRDFIAIMSGFRKFSIMVLLIVVGMVFRMCDYISGAEFVDLLKNTAIAYMTFNGIEHMTGAIKDWLASRSAD